MIGGVIGTLAVLIVGGLGVFLWAQQRRRADTAEAKVVELQGELAARDQTISNQKDGAARLESVITDVKARLAREEELVRESQNPAAVLADVRELLGGTAAAAAPGAAIGRLSGPAGPAPGKA